MCWQHLPNRLAAAAPWLKTNQCCGCENLNKQESGLVVAQLQKRHLRRCQEPKLVTPCKLAMCCRAGWPRGESWPLAVITSQCYPWSGSG